ncbi:MAG: ABC transporter permease [Alphaproteobacteria bacterium]|nr:ABC transporter permease [Alphaproteobacteria bacterium]MCB9792875.1 ABC transporter permease [Alphaproteobacteria bacterium]
MRDLLREGLEGLWAHRVRSLLSTLGILFGVAAVIGILSIGEGARQEQEALIAELGVNNFQVRNKEFKDPEAEEEVRRVSRGLSRKDVEALAETLPEAQRVGGMREVDVRDIVPRPKDISALRVLGADPNYLASTTLRRVEGRPLTWRDEEAASAVCLLGADAARALFSGEPAVGQRLRVDAVWLTVVGVVTDGSSGGGELQGVDLDDRDSDIILPLSAALTRFPVDDNAPELTELVVSLGDIAAVPGHSTLARRALLRLHREAEDVELLVPLKLLEQSQAQQRIFNLVMGLIAGISLLVGGIGIMNIMLASVLERTREIGVRLAVGARPTDIRLLFLAEAALISLIGGALGVVVGFVISFIVAEFTGWATSVSPQAILLATLVSMAEGVIFGLIPARRAAELPPAIAVRG